MSQNKKACAKYKYAWACVYVKSNRGEAARMVMEIGGKRERIRPIRGGIREKNVRGDDQAGGVPRSGGDVSGPGDGIGKNFGRD